MLQETANQSYSITSRNTEVIAYSLITFGFDKVGERHTFE